MYEIRVKHQRNLHSPWVKNYVVENTKSTKMINSKHKNLHKCKPIILVLR